MEEIIRERGRRGKKSCEWLCRTPTGNILCVFLVIGASPSASASAAAAAAADEDDDDEAEEVEVSADAGSDTGVAAVADRGATASVMDTEVVDAIPGVVCSMAAVTVDAGVVDAEVGASMADNEVLSSTEVEWVVF